MAWVRRPGPDSSWWYRAEFAGIDAAPTLIAAALSAVQQLAAAIGSAVVTSVYFSQRAQHGAGHAMTVSVAVGAIALLCLGLVWLMPRAAPADPAGEH